MGKKMLRVMTLFLMGFVVVQYVGASPVKRAFTKVMELIRVI